MSRQRYFNAPTDNYFSAPKEVVGPDGARYDATIGTCEIVQNWDSLTRQVSFSGILDCSLNVSQQLQHRKFYVGCAIDDWDEYELSARVELLLNNSVVCTLPLNRAFPPPQQEGPAGLDKITLVPATILDRVLITGAVQWDIETPNMPCPDMQNKLITNFSYSHDGDDYEYWARISPLHLHVMCNKVQIVVDKWTATPNAFGDFGLATFILACVSNRYPTA